MNKNEIKPWDWARIIIGEVPPSFYLEAVIRAILLYLLLMISVRLWGKRMAGQIDRIEIAGLVTLAAAIGVPLLSPDRGLLPPVIIALVVVGIGRLVAKMAYKSEKFEKKTHGDIASFVTDGVVQLDNLESTTVSVEEVKLHLRNQSIMHLGEVRRFYLEAGGTFTLIKEEKPQPGLSILPEWDKEFIGQQKKAGKPACPNCGLVQEHHATYDNQCDNCGHMGLTEAVIS